MNPDFRDTLYIQYMWFILHMIKENITLMDTEAKKTTASNIQSLQKLTR